jgi:putative salt-induced outer membrane protein YdiY
MNEKKLKFALGFIAFQIVFLFLIWSEGNAQQDTLVTKYGDVLVGKIDKINSETVNFKVKYRKDAVEIKLIELARISSTNSYVLNDIKNKNWKGALVLDTLQSGQLGIQTKDSVRFFKPREVFEIGEDKKKTLKDKLTLSLDFGINRIKASNSLSANLGVNAGFRTRRWDIVADYSAYSVEVSDVLNYWRNGSFATSYILPKDWFILGKYNLYTSTEQSLDIRRNFFLGWGKIFVNQIDQSFNLSLGVVSNREKYFEVDEVFTSTESFLKAYYFGKIGDNWEAKTDVSLFPSLSQSGRFRSNLNFNLNYKFLNHFKLGIRYTLNTDNQPQVEAAKSDYVFAINFGWTLKKY